MSMSIVTHPDNIEKLRKLLKESDDKKRIAESDHIFCMKPFGIEIIGNSALQKERPTGRYKIAGNQFCTYWDGKGKPPSWALYFGYVVPIMEPVFYEINNPTVWSPTKWR